MPTSLGVAHVSRILRVISSNTWQKRKPSGCIGNMLLTIGPQTTDDDPPQNRMLKGVVSFVGDSSKLRSNTFFLRSRSLVSVSFKNCIFLDDKGVFTFVKNAPLIKYMFLDGARAITNHSVEIIVTLKYLRVLSIANCPRLNDKCVGLQFALVSLQELKVHDNHFGDELFLNSLVREKVVFGYKKSNASKSRLVRCDFSRLPLSRDCLNFTLWRFTSLTSLCIEDSDLGNETMASFAQWCSPMIHLNVSGAKDLSDEGLLPVIRKSSELETLNISRTKATLESVIAAIETSSKARYIGARKMFPLYGENSEFAESRLLTCLCESAVRLERIYLDCLMQDGSFLNELVRRLKAISRCPQNRFSNLALGCQDVFQSSHIVDFSRGAHYATDGDMSSKFGEAWFCPSATTTMTALESEAYLELDLGSVEHVDSILVKLPDDKHGTPAQFPLFVFASKKPFGGKTVEETLDHSDYLVKQEYFDEPTVGVRVDVKSPIRYVRVQQSGRPRPLSIGQVCVFRSFLFMKPLVTSFDASINERVHL